jgi:hypothetical protein
MNSRHFMNPAVAKHMQGAAPDAPSELEQEPAAEGQSHTGRLHITDPEGKEQVHHFSATDHDSLLGQIHEFLQSGSEHDSLTDVDAMDAGDSDASAGGVHANRRSGGVIP